MSSATTWSSALSTISPSRKTWAVLILAYFYLQWVAPLLKNRRGSQTFGGSAYSTPPKNKRAYTTGFQDIFLISFNDVEISAFKLDTAEEDMPTAFVAPFIIPPFTTVKIECKSSVNNTAWMASIGVTGEAYGMTETGYQ